MKPRVSQVLDTYHVKLQLYFFTTFYHIESTNNLTSSTLNQNQTMQVQ